MLILDIISGQERRKDCFKMYKYFRMCLLFIGALFCHINVSESIKEDFRFNYIQLHYSDPE